MEDNRMDKALALHTENPDSIPNSINGLPGTSRSDPWEPKKVIPEYLQVWPQTKILITEKIKIRTKAIGIDCYFSYTQQ